LTNRILKIKINFFIADKNFDASRIKKLKMSSISPRNYQIGVCFMCQLCMYCGVDLTSNNCNCDKIIKPTKKNRTVEVPNFRNLVYKPGKIHEEITKALSIANQK
jgi:hypothetical protein